MRINKARRSETRIWESGGPEAYEFRRAVRRAARPLAAPGRPVEIYACARAGGWVADVFEYDAS